MSNAVRFDKKWFNPLYFIVNNIIKDPNVRTVLVYGGKSSAKTLSICQLLAKEAALYSANSICFRKESVTIKTTLKESFKKAIKASRLHEAFTTMEFSFRGYQGSEIVMKGLDDEEKGKGIESFKYLFLDELNHFLLSEYEQLQMSLRGIEGQKVFAAWNPIDQYSWVKTDLIDTIVWKDTDVYGTLPFESSFVRVSEDGKTILIKTSYPDNYWIVGSPCGTYGYKDENLIAFYNKMKERNFNSYRVNVLGEWGKTDYGGEFLKKWRSEIHVKKKPYKQGLAVNLIFDENVNPYFPCGIFQVEEMKDAKGVRVGYDVWMCKEFALKNPYNTVKDMGREINAFLHRVGHNEAVYIGGDATSQKEDVKQVKGHNLFVLIANEIAKYKPQFIMWKSNPSVKVSADFFNEILEFNFANIHFSVDESCSTAITDFEQTKEDKNGGVDKKTVTDPATKVSYQPFGHFTDLTRYFLVQKFTEEYYNYQRGESASGMLTYTNAKHKF